MGNIIKVGMADLNVCKAPDGLTTLGLGSCIGLTLYDPVTKIGGMVHYMLPDSTKVSNNSNKAKFADTGIEELLKKVIAAGQVRQGLLPRLLAVRRCLRSVVYRCRKYRCEKCRSSKEDFKRKRNPAGCRRHRIKLWTHGRVTL